MSLASSIDHLLHWVPPSVRLSNPREYMYVTAIDLNDRSINSSTA